MTDRQMRVLKQQYVKAIREPDEYVKFYITPEDAKIWYILIRNLGGVEGELAKGEYLFKVMAPDDITDKPPTFHALTPNGIYDINKAVCISIGHYHSDQFRPALGMRGFCLELANGMMNYKELVAGISIIEGKTSIHDKRKLAETSRRYNRKHYGEIIKAIESAYEEYSAKWDLTQVNERLAKVLGLEKQPPAETVVEDPDAAAAELAAKLEKCAVGTPVPPDPMLRNVK